MNQILFDIGNSSINWALQSKETCLAKGRFDYRKENIVPQLQHNIRHLVKEPPAAVLVSSVASKQTVRQLQSWVRQNWQLEIWDAQVATHFGSLKNSYHEIKELGVDRWLAMIAAWECYQTGLCIVDCGTALTIDMVAADGNHAGGYLLPGIFMMQQTLNDKTENINLSGAHDKLSISLSNNTTAAVTNGATLATVATIDYVVNTLDNETQCIITGGMAEYIQPLLAHTFIHVPDLVLKGLVILYKATQ